MKPSPALAALLLATISVAGAGCAHDGNSRACAPADPALHASATPPPSREFNSLTGNFERRPPFGSRGTCTQDLD